MLPPPSTTDLSTLMRHIYICEYGLGDVVYYRTGDSPAQGVVIGIMFRPGGSAKLQVSWADGGVSSHYPVELSTEPVATHEESF